MKNLINDEQSLVGAKGRFGHPIPTYDDGFGKLYVHRDSMGITGIVRAQCWEDAYSIVEDEFMPDCDLTHEELLKEYGFTREHVKIIHPLEAGIINYAVERPAKNEDYEKSGGKLLREQFVRWETIDTPSEDYAENPLFQESYGFRNNSGKKNFIYSKDLNGDWLDLLTPELLVELGITLEISDNE